MSRSRRNLTAPLTMVLALGCAAVGLVYSGWRAELRAQGYYYGPTCVNGTLTLTSRPGSDLDIGWTGIGHDSAGLEDAAVTTDLDCPAGESCTIDGGGLAGTTLGGPLPLSSGGVAMCVINTFREAVTGTYDCSTGCSTSSFKLTAQFFLTQDIAKPCPTCVGDPISNDGQKGGTCDGGATPGGACDIGGVHPTFGATSNDCLPAGSSVGEPAIDLDPLTTGAVALDAAVDCASALWPAGSCHCPGQVQPNPCLDGVCGASGICENGPVDGRCSGQPFHYCRPDTGTEDCEDVFPGAGTCLDALRSCFGDTIVRTGTCGAEDATLASIFCLPVTRAAAINTVLGLPGPVAIAVPVRRAVSPAPTPTPVETPTAIGTAVGTAPTPVGTPGNPTPTDAPAATATAPAPTPTPSSPCGNRLIEGGEECDDGNTAAGDCCSPTCQFESDGSVCADGLDCTLDDVCANGVCSGSAQPVCEEVSASVPAGATVTTDSEGDGATSGDPIETTVTSPNAGEITIVEMLASGTPPRGFLLLNVHVDITAPAGTPAQPLQITFFLDSSIIPFGDDENTIQIFKDGAQVKTCVGAPSAIPNPCIARRQRLNGDIVLTVLTATASEWSFAVAGCATLPLGGCRRSADPRMTVLLLEDKTLDRQDELAWRWLAGEQTPPEALGDPRVSESYAVCIYQQSAGGPTTVLQARAHAGGTCGGNPCWRQSKGGFIYRSERPNGDGLTRLALRPGDTRKARITVKGEGANLPMPSLPLELPVIVQLQATNGECWEASYSASGVGRNDTERFRATAER